ILFIRNWINYLEIHQSSDVNLNNLKGSLSSYKEFCNFLWASYRGGEAYDLKISFSDKA
ncbi:unnamed protein product, partial [marine sediment metagenome]